MSPRIINRRQRRRFATELRRAYEQGASIRALAHLTGRSHGYIQRLLHEAGTTMRPVGGQKKPPSALPRPPGLPLPPSGQHDGRAVRGKARRRAIAPSSLSKDSLPGRDL